MKKYSSKQAKKGKLAYRTPSWFISERQRGNKVLAEGKVFIFQRYKEVVKRKTRKK